jgi:hypothetical protein
MSRAGWCGARHTKRDTSGGIGARSGVGVLLECG